MRSTLITSVEGDRANARHSGESVWLSRIAWSSGESRWCRRPNPPRDTNKPACRRLGNTFHRPATTGWYSAMRAAAAVQFRRIALNPTPDGDVVNAQVSLSHNFFKLAEAQRIPQVPADAQHNDLGLELPPFEQRRTFASHAGRSLSDSLAPVLQRYRLSSVGCSGSCTQKLIRSCPTGLQRLPSMPTHTVLEQHSGSKIIDS